MADSGTPDPEFLQLKREFAATLGGRARLLRELAVTGKDAELVFQCHKLAGVAGSYGFHALTEGADLLEAKIPRLGCRHAVVAVGIAWLVESLELTGAKGEESAELAADFRLVQLRRL